MSVLARVKASAVRAKARTKTGWRMYKVPLAFTVGFGVLAGGIGYNLLKGYDYANEKYQSYQKSPSGDVRVIPDCDTGVNVQQISNKEEKSPVQLQLAFPPVDKNKINAIVPPDGKPKSFFDKEGNQVGNVADHSAVFTNSLTGEKVGIIQEDASILNKLNVISEVLHEQKKSGCNTDIIIPKSLTKTSWFQQAQTKVELGER